MKTKYASELSGTTVKAIIGGGSNKVRDFLGGYLSQELFQLLDTIAGNENMSVYGALYELQQRDLIEKLKAIGKRAHIVLSNGSFKLKGEDKNSESREELKDAGVDVYDRIVAPQHFGHNKFLVICENDQKKHVWTGSTNWTPGGLFSQVNNGIYIPNNPTLANVYYTEWVTLRDAGDSSIDPSLLGENANSLPGKSYPHVWFSPKKITGDLNDVSALMDSASQGILFLMFNPGPRGTLFNKVLELQAQKPGLFIRGVINQDPGGANHLIFFHRGNQDKANWSDILPDKISKDFGYWDSEESAGMVTIHSKVMVIDPFTDNAAIVTGSNNFGPKASQKNDDNLIIIRDKKLAQEYTVNILAVYDHYRWRYSLSQADPSFTGLSKDLDWMKQYMSSLRGDELKNFWFK
jgi:phosphatidylserine/phosphatidylglycerophosphate/cardiolipin synthase-like enzyme